MQTIKEATALHRDYIAAREAYLDERDYLIEIMKAGAREEALSYQSSITTAAFRLSEEKFRAYLGERKMELV